MIDPQEITNFNRTDAELEEFLLFCVAVAGKTASTIAQQLDRFLLMVVGNESPFAKIRILLRLGKLRSYLEKAKLGKYGVLERAYTQLVESDIHLRVCEVGELEAIYGIGPKTARYFLLHSRRNQNLVPLDTHALKFLSTKGYKVPKSTPTGKRYYELEKAFIEEAKKAGKSVAAFDLEIWNNSSIRSGKHSGK